MRELSNVIMAATMRIARAFIEFPIDDREREIRQYRERIYCYELYHQMRCGWDDVCEGFTLNGEVDKNGHEVLRKRGINGGIPDLLVHRPGPGGMAHNHAIIEVKAPTVDDEGIKRDLQKLDKFVLLADYARALFLVYASGPDRDGEWIERVQRIMRANRIETPIELWLHRCPMTPAERVN